MSLGEKWGYASLITPTRHSAFTFTRWYPGWVLETVIWLTGLLWARTGTLVSIVHPSLKSDAQFLCRWSNHRARKYMTVTQNRPKRIVDSMNPISLSWMPPSLTIRSETLFQLLPSTPGGTVSMLALSSFRSWSDLVSPVRASFSCLYGGERGV